MPETIFSEIIFSGHIFDIKRDRVSENGTEYTREVVVHRGSAVIVPVFDDETVALVRQYRHAAGKFLLEVPAGSLDEGEDPAEGAARELVEEVGVTAAHFEKLSEFYVSPGFLTEKMFVFLATGLTEVGQQLESDEFIELVRVTFPEAFSKIRSGEIEEAKTIIGLITAGSRYGHSL